MATLPASARLAAPAADDALAPAQPARPSTSHGSRIAAGSGKFAAPAASKPTAPGPAAPERPHTSGALRLPTVAARTRAASKEKASAAGEKSGGCERGALKDSASKTDQASRIIAAFQAFDTNGDGCIDRSELERLCWALNAEFSDAELQGLIQQADVDGDGCVQYEEFVRWICGDDSALNRLRSSKLAVGSEITIRFKSAEGRQYSMQARTDDSVQHLRHRACQALQMPADKLQDLQMSIAGHHEPLSASVLAKSLQNKELLVTFGSSGNFFGALRLSSEVVRWRATVDGPVELNRFNAPLKVSALCVLPAAVALCALCGNSTVVAWDARSTRQLWRVDRMTGARFLVGGSNVFVIGMDDCVLALESLSGTQVWIARVPNANESIKALHASPDTVGAICTVSESGKLCCWDAKTGRKRWKAQHSNSSDAESFLLSGATREDAASPWALFSADNLGLVIAWDMRSGGILWKTHCSSPVQAMCYREVYDTLCVGTHEGLVLVLEGRTGDRLFEEDVGPVNCMQGRRQSLFVAGRGDVLSSWDTLNRRQDWEIDVSQSVGGLAESDGGRSLAARCSPTVPRSGSRHLQGNDSDGSSQRGSRRIGTSGSGGEHRWRRQVSPGESSNASGVTAHARSAQPGGAENVSILYLEDVDKLSVGTADGVSLYDSKQGKLNGTVTIPGGVRLLTYAPPM